MGHGHDAKAIYYTNLSSRAFTSSFPLNATLTIHVQFVLLG